MGRPASTITKQTNPRAIPRMGQQWFTCTAEEGVKTPPFPGDWFRCALWFANCMRELHEEVIFKQSKQSKKKWTGHAGAAGRRGRLVLRHRMVGERGEGGDWEVSTWVKD